MIIEDACGSGSYHIIHNRAAQQAFSSMLSANLIEKIGKRFISSRE